MANRVLQGDNIRVWSVRPIAFRACAPPILPVIRIILGVIWVGVIWETIRMKKRPGSAMSKDCRRFCSASFALR